jgi:hypothetical protein
MGKEKVIKIKSCDILPMLNNGIRVYKDMVQNKPLKTGKITLKSLSITMEKIMKMVFELKKRNCRY